MKEYIVHLKPESGFTTLVNSDTIFGAICWGIRDLFGETKLVEDVLAKFQCSASPPFLISSAFPYQQLDPATRHYYFPLPCSAPLTRKDLQAVAETNTDELQQYHSGKKRFIDTISQYKKFKKLRWIEATHFKEFLQNPSEKILFSLFLKGKLESPLTATRGITQKNSLDRLTNSTSGSGNTFYTHEDYYRQDAGIYFLLQCDNFNEYLKPVLGFLEDSGIGADRKTGKSWFSLEVLPQNLLPKKRGNAFINLSRYIGMGESFDIPQSFYQLQTTRSKVESRDEFASEDIWKKRVTSFSAGSLLKPKEIKEVYGAIFPVKRVAEKDIFQYGYAYPVWLNI